MPRDVLAGLVFLATDPPSTDSDNAITIALIGAGSPILVALIALVATLLQRRRNAAPTVVAEDEDEERLKVLERFLLRHGLDPEKVTTGNEMMTDVRIF